MFNRLSGPVPQETLDKAAEMLEDGCSFSDISKSIPISRDSLAKYFPGRAWTPKQRAAHGVLVKTMNRKISKVHGPVLK